MRFLIAGLIVLTGCSDQGVCAGVSRGPALAVAVVDSMTGTAIAAGASLLIYAGATKVDSVTGTRDDEVLLGADDQTGEFRVLVRRLGYTDWERTNVTISGSCVHINMIALTARLTHDSH